MYSEKVMEHFTDPRNVGEIEDADGIGEVGNPVCGDMMTFHVKVADGRLADVKFRTFGCGAAIAVSSMVSEMAKGKTVAEALEITNRDVASELGGLPKHKMHCSNLGAEALHKAIEDYLGKSAKRTEDKKPASPPDATGAPVPPMKDRCKCPYCDAEVPEGAPFCEPCGARIAHCASCGKAIPAGGELCESCAAEPAGVKGGGHG